MADEELSPTLLKAGEEYLEALRRLRLEPEGLLWARVNEAFDNALDSLDEWGNQGDWHLVLITSAIEEGGPLALNELLFKAYRLSATPKEISPFIVDVISARSPMVVDLVQQLNAFGRPPVFYTMVDGKEVRQESDAGDTFVMVSGFWFSKKWIYHLEGVAADKRERRRHWHEFSESVNGLAA